MNQLVFVENGQAVTDSLTVSDVFGKDHDKVMRDIIVQIKKLNEAGEIDFSTANFVGSTYTSRGRSYEKFNLTEDAFTLIAMSYITVDAMKFKVKFIQEFKKMKEHLNGPKVLSEKEQLMASMKLSLETAEEMTIIKNDIQQIKHQVSEELTLNHGQQQALHHEIKKRVEMIKNDFDKLSKRELYSQIHSHLRRAFSAPKYLFVKRKDYEEAISWVRSWRPLI
ncbi:Rha family transcriptional regulator [Metabacillus indicus]|uniref:Rha family transcriptional regulator n=1 Tax=Metabacillus indicus TaxID=246786 RepID=UPI002A064C5F|nr:Rha family transcriptional regulator [Metabacillus indicus]MDX8288861.1 Rha family transcriptional regulator [Metabacillus indicus]